ncbi:hypothetical protein PSCICJ_04230 [Pseudomonas cichorii]|nr:hypothetical protein PSCICJ_04230 [Pseudomonas cichorii]
MTHAFDQFDRQQRVAAQFEEMVMTAYLLNAQQFLPEPGNDFLDFALRRFIVPADQG